MACFDKKRSLTLLFIVICGCSEQSLQVSDTTANDAGDKSHVPVNIKPIAPATPTSKVNVLFNGTLNHWQATNFGGEAEIEVSGEGISLPAGYPMTGINWTGPPLPTQDYEIALQAKKTEGNDFFCGLTFPVGDSHCSLILGGWGGSLVGLSCIDGDDASNNGTKQFHRFETGKWYQINVFVDENGIEVKLDGKVIINQARLGHTFSVRNETLPCRPLGICNFQTSSVIRKIVLTTNGNETAVKAEN